MPGTNPFDSIESGLNDLKASLGYPVGSPSGNGVQTSGQGASRLLQSCPCAPFDTLVPFTPPTVEGAGVAISAAQTLQGIAPAQGQRWQVRGITLDSLTIINNTTYQDPPNEADLATNPVAALTAMLYCNGVLLNFIPLGTKQFNEQSDNFGIWAGAAPTVDGETVLMPNDVLSMILVAQSGDTGDGPFQPEWLPGGAGYVFQNDATLIGFTGSIINA
jgi:hypothetical protein